MKRPAMASGPTPLPKMMLGFVVRRCAVAVGHEPSAEEFAAWANSHQNGERTSYLFGRPISVREAEVILRHPGRPVTARSATAIECAAPDDRGAAAKVTSFAAAVARLKTRARS